MKTHTIPSNETFLSSSIFHGGVTLLHTLDSYGCLTKSVFFPGFKADDITVCRNDLVETIGIFAFESAFVREADMQEEIEASVDKESLDPNGPSLKVRNLIENLCEEDPDILENLGDITAQTGAGLLTTDHLDKIRRNILAQATALHGMVTLYRDIQKQHGYGCQPEMVEQAQMNVYTLAFGAALEVLRHSGRTATAPSEDDAEELLEMMGVQTQHS